MTLGQRIKKLRIKKELTQKDLADRLNVTFQTVSKWENDENEPDVATLKELAKLFGCSLDALLSEEEHQEEQKEAEASPVKTVTETIIIHQKEMHVCERCKKDIPEDDLVIEDVCVRTPGRGRSGEYKKDYYHKDCFELTKNERKEKAAKERAYKASQAKKRAFGWGIAGGIIALAVSLIVFLIGSGNPVIGVMISILIGYAIFATIYCIITKSYIEYVFLFCSTASIKFPRLIFSWDIGGFIWVIGMKILFAILGFLFGIFAFFFGLALSAALSVISFPFVLIHNIHNQYADAF